MKMPHQLVTAFPIPDRSKVMEVIIDKELNPKRSFNSPYTVFVIGLATLHFFLVTDPMRGHRLALFMQWAVLIITIIVAVNMVVETQRRVNIKCQKVDACYDAYLDKLEHLQVDWEVKNYYGCLCELKQLKLERKYLYQYNEHYHREYQWMRHKCQFSPMVLEDDMPAQRGANLKNKGFLRFYHYYEGNNQNLVALYKKHLTIEEIHTFLALKRSMCSTFHHEPTANELLEEAVRFKLELDKEEAEIMGDMEMFYEQIATNRRERYALHLAFKDEYFRLAREFNLTLPPFS